MARDRVPQVAPDPSVGRAFGAVVLPSAEPEMAARAQPPLRDSLRRPVNVQQDDATPYRMSEDERRKMREWLRNQAQESPLK